MISASGQPAATRPVIIVVSVVRTLRPPSSAASPNATDPARDWAVERAMLAIEVHRHQQSPQFSMIVE